MFFDSNFDVLLEAWAEYQMCLNNTSGVVKQTLMSVDAPMREIRYISQGKDKAALERNGETLRTHLRVVDNWARELRKTEQGFFDSYSAHLVFTKKTTMAARS